MTQHPSVPAAPATPAAVAIARTSAEAPHRLPYQAPALTRFGALAELTRTAGYRGRKDGRRSYRRTGY